MAKRALLAAILLVGLALRVGYAWQGEAPVYDAKAYARIARTLDRDGSFSQGPDVDPRRVQPASNYSPGLPLATAAVYKLSGGVHPRLARLIFALIGTLSILFAYLIGRRLAGAGAGLIAAAAVAAYPALLEYQGMLMSEPLAATCLSGSILALFWAEDRGRPAAWLLPGLLLGATAMVRPEYLAVAVLLAAICGLRGLRSAPRPALARTALVLAGVALVVAPWTVRNLIVLDRLVPISTGGGQVLFAGAYLPSGGDPQQVGAEVVARHPGLFDPADATRLRLEIILARLAARRYPGMPSDEALQRMGRERLRYDLSHEPLRYAGFLAAKVGAIWSHGPRRVMRMPAWEALHWALVAFGLIGLALLGARRRREALVIAAVLLAVTAIGALLVASPRRVLVAIPLVAALAGAGAVEVLSAARSGQSRWRTRGRSEPRPASSNARAGAAPP